MRHMRPLDTPVALKDNHAKTGRVLFVTETTAVVRWDASGGAQISGAPVDHLSIQRDTPLMQRFTVVR